MGYSRYKLRLKIVKNYASLTKLHSWNSGRGRGGVGREKVLLSLKLIKLKSN